MTTQKYSDYRVENLEYNRATVCTVTECIVHILVFLLIWVYKSHCSVGHEKNCY